MWSSLMCTHFSPLNAVSYYGPHWLHRFGQTLLVWTDSAGLDRLCRFGQTLPVWTDSTRLDRLRLFGYRLCRFGYRLRRFGYSLHRVW